MFTSSIDLSCFFGRTIGCIGGTKISCQGDRYGEITKASVPIQLIIIFSVILLGVLRRIEIRQPFVDSSNRLGIRETIEVHKI